jgi:hypothetical protein
MAKDQKRPAEQEELRGSITSEVVIPVAVGVSSGGAGAAVSHYLSRPKPEAPAEVYVPPGTKKP